MNADKMLAEVRRAVENVYVAPEPQSAEGQRVMRHLVAVADYFRALDDHLSGGGTPPEAWREGPDAPELDDVGICGARLHQQSTYDGSMYLSVCTKTPGHFRAGDVEHEDETRGGAPKAKWSVELPWEDGADAARTPVDPLGAPNPAHSELPDHDLTAAAPVEHGEREQ